MLGGLLISDIVDKVLFVTTDHKKESFLLSSSIDFRLYFSGILNLPLFNIISSTISATGGSFFTMIKGSIGCLVWDTGAV